MTNAEFLLALFGVQYGRVHVTSFAYDPSAIPKEEHLKCWAGGYFDHTTLPEGTNQYFTVSLFAPDETGRARRRKALFEATYVVVLDDVKEKLSEEQAMRLPPPTYKLVTSLGSEQWGYKLDKPATERHRVENLLDGLVASGLAPDGKDPGMKGVTRYVRLPEGVNTKASKQVFGMPFKCRLSEWHPERTTTLEALAAPFGVNLDAERRDTRVDGAAAVEGHPILPLLSIKEVRSDGRYDVTCPWVREHTGGADDGAAVFTNGDGSLGFKCHHGVCQERTGAQLLRWAEEVQPGFRVELSNWKVAQALAAMGHVPPAPPAPVAPVAPPPPAAPAPVGMDSLLEQLGRMHPNSAEAKQVATALLMAAEELPVIDQLGWHERVRDLMGWSKQDLGKIVKSLKTSEGAKHAKAFYHEHIFVKELNQFYHARTRTFLSVEAFTNANMHEDAEARKGALQDGLVTKVDRLDYLPGAPQIFVENGITYGNMYRGTGGVKGEEGDCSWWLEHWNRLGWEGDREHMLKWMAYTLRHPEHKINHMLILGSREGCGKDFLLYPLLAAMGEDAKVIDGDSLAEPYTGYLNGTKYLHINEAELGDRQEALALANKLKPIAAAPPELLRVRELFTKPYFVRNLVNGTMTTNSKLPLRLKESRRYYAVWSDLQTRGGDGNLLPWWQKYWAERWEWMKGEGVKHCIHYLQHHVDLSNFNPGTPPPMTDFLRHIQDESKSVVQRTVEAFIENHVGSFAADIVQTKDILATLKAGELVAPDLMFADCRYISLSAVVKVMSDIGCVQERLRTAEGQVRVWIIRNRDQLLSMQPADRAIFAEKQWAKLRNQTKLRVV